MSESSPGPIGSLWKRRFLGTSPVMRFSIQAAVILSSLVTVPALVARPWADERYVMYLPEHLVGSRPWNLATRVVDEIPTYLDQGVFRPFSRLLFYLEHWLVVRVGAATGIAPNVMMAFVKIAMIFAVVTMAMLTIDQYRRAAGGRASDVHWRRLYGLTAVVVALSLVLVNPATHPLTLFPGLYLGTSAMALAIPLWFGRSWLRYRSGQPLRRMWTRVGSAVIIGALVASSIELAYLALPLGFFHLLLLSFAAGDSWVATWKDLFHSEAFLLWALVTTGFLVVFVPARAAIADYCAVFSCYRGAEVSIGPDVLGVFPARVVSGFFPILQWSQVHLLRQIDTFVVLGLAAAAGAIGFMVLNRTAIEYEDDTRGRRPRLPMALLGLYFGAVLFFSSLLASLSGSVQDQGASVYPWRDSGFGWIAWSVIIAVLLTAVFDYLSDRSAMALAGTLAVLLVMTTFVNYVDMKRVNERTDTRVYNEAGFLLVNFDETDAGNQQRCDVTQDLLALAPSESELRKMERIGLYLDSAALNLYGTEFCDS